MEDSVNRHSVECSGTLPDAASVEGTHPIILTTSGEYSDYRVMGVFFWLSKKQPRELLEEYLAANPKQREDYQFEEDEFVGWLTQVGAIEDVPFETLHLGDYGESKGIETPTLALATDGPQ